MTMVADPGKESIPVGWPNHSASTTLH